MVFLEKAPCVRLGCERVLHSVPRDNAGVDLCYEILHFPQLHLDVFDSCDTTCQWLADLMSSNGLPYTVSCFDGHFLVQHERFRMSLAIPVEEVASSAFHPLDVDFLFVKQSLVDPCWMSHSNEHIRTVLLEIG
jgi:hypothetical protein